MVVHAKKPQWRLKSQGDEKWCNPALDIGIKNLVEEVYNLSGVTLVRMAVAAIAFTSV
jgi:hypothetical protein